MFVFLTGSELAMAEAYASSECKLRAKVRSDRQGAISDEKLLETATLGKLGEIGLAVLLGMDPALEVDFSRWERAADATHDLTFNGVTIEVKTCKQDGKISWIYTKAQDGFIIPPYSDIHAFVTVCKSLHDEAYRYVRVNSFLWFSELKNKLKEPYSASQKRSKLAIYNDDLEPKTHRDLMDVISTLKR